LNVECSGDFIVHVYKDLNTLSPAFSRSITSTTDDDPLWDGGIWDGGVWDSAFGTSLRRLRPETRGRYHAVKFTNDQPGKTFTIYATEFALRGGKEHT